MALISINKRLTTAQKNTVQSAVPILRAYLIGTDLSPGLLRIYANTTPARKILMRTHNNHLDAFLTLLESANIYI